MSNSNNEAGKLDNEKLEKLIKSIEHDVFKDYMKRTSDYDVLDFKSENNEVIENQNMLRTIRITKFVKNIEKADIDNLCTLFKAFADENCNIAFIFKHSCNGVEVYLRVLYKGEDASENSDSVRKLSDRAKIILNSVFEGIDLNEEPSEWKLEQTKYITFVSAVPGEKNDIFFGLENLFNYSTEKEYTLVLVAEPLKDDEIKNISDKLCNYLTDISTYETQQSTYGNSSGKTNNVGVHASFYVGIDVGHADSKFDSTGNTINRSNYTVKHMISQISKNLERLDLGKALGCWKFSAYVMSDYKDVSLNTAYRYEALVTGKNNDSIASSVEVWEDKKANNIYKYLKRNLHPKFKNTKEKPEESEESEELVEMTTVVNTVELAYAMNFPRKSVPGFPVLESVAFGRNVLSKDEILKAIKSRESLEIGSVYHMYHTENAKVNLDKDSLTSHTFITGSTGAGKTNTVYQILKKATERGVKFLVVEPAKGEYKEMFGPDCNLSVSVYGTNPALTKLLRINPFSFPKGIHVSEHIDRLVEIFNVCWPMYAAMPAILKDAVIRSYQSCGWNMVASQNINNNFPNFMDLLREIRNVLKESEYSADNKGDYTGALVARIKSLTNGINGQIFSGTEISNEDLFKSNVIVDLSRVGSTETKSLIMGLLMIKLQEYRLSDGKPQNSGLKHITVLEEAHNLLKRTSTEQTTETANLLGKSVELIANSIAELRSFGEGFIIADQSPGLLDMSVIRNTNTKIIHRLPDFSDRQLVGRAAGLNDGQINELSKLGLGVAAVYQNDWIEPVLCKIEKFKKDENDKGYIYEDENAEKITDDEEKLKKELILLLLKGRTAEQAEPDMTFVEKNIEKSTISGKIKSDVKRYITEYNKTNKLSIWKDENFEELSETVTGIFADKSDITGIIKSKENIDDVNKALSGIIDDKLFGLGNAMKIAILQCFMRCYADTKERLDDYVLWRNYMKDKLGKVK